MDVTRENVRVSAGQLRDYFALLWRRRWIILISALVGLLGAAAWSRSVTPVYVASASLQIGEVTAVPFSKQFDLLGGRSDQITSEIEILKSRMVAQQVVEKLNPGGWVHRAPAGIPVSISPIVAKAQVPPGDFTVEFTDSQGGYKVIDPNGRLVGRGEKGVPFEAGGLAFTISDVRAKEGDFFQFMINSFQEAADRLRARLRVTPIRGTNMVNVQVENESPVEAAKIANAIAEAYIAYNIRWRSRQASTTKHFIGNQLEDLRKDLQASAEAIKNYKSAKGVITLSDETKRRLEQLATTEAERMRVERERKQLEAVLGQIRGQTQGPSQTPTSVLSDVPNPRLKALAATLADLEIRRAMMGKRFTERHQSILMLDSEIRGIKGKLVEEVEPTVRALKEQESVLANLVSRYETGLKSIPETEVALAGLLRNSLVNEDLYSRLLQRHEEARIVEASEIGGAAVIDPAIAPRTPVRPTTKRNTVLGGILGLAVGIALAFFLEYQDRSMRSVQELEREVRLPVFGAIPEISSRGSALRMTDDAVGEVFPDCAKLILHLRPGSPAAEAYRSLRTNIQFALPDAAERGVFLFTSAGPKEGKSLTVANLAVALTQLGVRILVVDADLRQPKQHKLFRSEAEVGITDVLAKNVSWPEAVRSTGVENLYLLPSGQVPPNPVELLARRQMKALLKEASQQYDLILIDSPPALLFTDACVLASLVDGVFIVVRAGQVTPDAVARTQSLLVGVKAKVVGAILNGTPSADGYGPYGYRYGYHYKEHYADAQTPVEYLLEWLRDITRRILLRKRR
jgi:tyrosine-protein kinase Etk/Wzc